MWISLCIYKSFVYKKMKFVYFKEFYQVLNQKFLKIFTLIFFFISCGKEKVPKDINNKYLYKKPT